MVVGYCKYVPIETPLILMPKAQVSIASLGNKSAHQKFIPSEADKYYIVFPLKIIEID